MTDERTCAADVCATSTEIQVTRKCKVGELEREKIRRVRKLRLETGREGEVF